MVYSVVIEEYTIIKIVPTFCFVTGQTVSGIPIETVFEIQQFSDGSSAFIRNIVELDLEDANIFRDYGTKEVRNEWPLRIKVKR